MRLYKDIFDEFHVYQSMVFDSESIVAKDKIYFHLFEYHLNRFYPVFDNSNCFVGSKT